MQKSFWTHSLAIISAIIIPVATFAKCGYPVDEKHQAIASPAGNLSYVSLPNSLCSPSGEYTWSFLGTVDSNSYGSNPIVQPHSLEITLLQVAQLDRSQIGINSLSFSFYDDGSLFRVDSAYGGEDAISTALEQGITRLDLKHDLKGMNLTSQSISTTSSNATKWQITSRTPEHSSSPLFPGYLGQPGHKYNFIGQGATFLWRITENGEQTIQRYSYNTQVDMVDERGVIGEGFGGAFVGPDLTTTSSKQSSFTEYEIGLPRLKVNKWHIKLTAMTDDLPAGFKQEYSYSGSSGMLWADFGPVIMPEQKRLSKLSSTNPDKLLKQLQQRADDGISLYTGNWIYTQFTDGIYKGAAVVVVPFWNKTEKNPSDQSTELNSWSSAGFLNVFTGLIADDPASAYTVNDVLVKGNPAIVAEPPLAWRRPFTLKLVNFANADKYDLLFPWATEAELTIKGNTQARFALAAYAMRLNPNIKDDPSKPLVINIKAINQANEHILFSKKITQYSEAAAISRVNSKVVGNGWIEHMVKVDGH